MSKKTAIITGVTGQDGAYLARLLLDKGYIVYGTYRRTSTYNFWRLVETDVLNNPDLSLIEFDITDLSAAIRLLEIAKPDEVYNLAAQSYVGVSFEQPIATTQMTGLGALHLLEAIRIVNPLVRFYQASSSEMFGMVQSVPQNEETPFYPRSPYGVAKLYAHWMTINYRESHGMFTVSGILFNHESPLRGTEFVTRKISDAIAKIKLGKQEVLELGNLDAKRDWGYAGEYVYGMWKMMQQDNPDNYVLATGETWTVRDFVDQVCLAGDINIEWRGEGVKEHGVDAKTGNTIIKVNPKFYRPAEVDLLIGDATKAKDVLDWTPDHSLEKLCSMMFEADLQRNNISASDNYQIC